MSPRTYAALEDLVPFDDWVEGDRGSGLIPWRLPGDARSRFTTTVDFLSAMARAVSTGHPLPDVLLLDDVVPPDPRSAATSQAAEVTAAIRHLARQARKEPRIVVVTGAKIAGQDLLAMLEFGADDVVRKSDQTSNRADTQFRAELRQAVDRNRTPGHATTAMRILADWWPPNAKALDGVDPRVRRHLLDLLPLLPLWADGVDEEQLVDLHFRDGVTERQLTGDMRGVNRRYMDPGLWAKRRARTPMRGVVSRGARADGLLWIHESTRSGVRALPWKTILAGCDTRVTALRGHAPLASATDEQLRRRLYPIDGDPRREHGGHWIYRDRVT